MPPPAKRKAGAPLSDTPAQKHLTVLSVVSTGGRIAHRLLARERLVRERPALDRDRLAVAVRPPREWLALLRPPFADAVRLVALPRPDPLFLPPPVSLLTVAHARRSATFLLVPRFS
jgi:hypothetical protein